MSALSHLIAIVRNCDTGFLDEEFGADANPGDIAEQVYAAAIAEVIAERDAMTVTWLVKKAREFRAMGGRMRTAQADAVAAMASKIERGAVRPDNLRTLPADFFQPGHTYTRQVHADTAQFRVESVATHPDGHPVAFGWYRREPRTSWHSYSSADFFDGWTDVTRKDGRS
jgi:hypothetical protein